MLSGLFYFGQMNHDIIQKKKALRNSLRTQRNQISSDVKEVHDDLIRQGLRDIVNTRKLKTVHIYLPMKGEIDLFPFIQELLDSGIMVICPKTLPNRELEHRVLSSLNDLLEGVMHTFHPKNPEVYVGEIDVIIIPGLAFDKHGYRLGYGGGYYDDFLAQHPESLKVGTFYSFQEVEEVPRESHDLAMNMVIKEEKPITF